MLRNDRLKWRLRQLCGALFLAVVLFSASDALAQKKGKLALSYTVGNGGGEVEFYLGSVGIGYSVWQATFQNTGCSALYSRGLVFARYFFSGAKDSWFLGGGQYSDQWVGTANCGQVTTSGLDLLFGYHWLFGSGFTVDLGFRPGILAVGFTF